jgi:hypothetical protein
VKKTAPAILPCMLDLAADRFVGPDVDEAIITLRRLQQVMLTRYAEASSSLMSCASAAGCERNGAWEVFNRRTFSARWANIS